jgi:hypothetical protein
VTPSWWTCAANGARRPACQNRSPRKRICSRATRPSRSPPLRFIVPLHRRRHFTLAWSAGATRGETPMCRPSIGRAQCIFTCAVRLLVERRVYSHVPSFYWSSAEYIPMCRPSIGRAQFIFTCAVLLLVERRVYSHVPSFYWSGAEYIPMCRPSIGQTRSTFP